MIVLVTGDRNVGKTTVVRTLISRLHERGLTTVGFYQMGEEVLELVCAQTGERMVFATQGAFEDGPEVGAYTVNPEAIAWGRDLSKQEGDVLALDEIGKLERRGEGFAPLLRDIRPADYRAIVISVRKGMCDVVAEHFPDESAIERIEVTESNRETVPDRIIHRLFEGES